LENQLILSRILIQKREGGTEIATVSKEIIACLHGLVTFIEPYRNDNTYCDSVLLIFKYTLRGLRVEYSKHLKCCREET
jgi:hypothetical protein